MLFSWQAQTSLWDVQSCHSRLKTMRRRGGEKKKPLRSAKQNHEKRLGPGWCHWGAEIISPGTESAYLVCLTCLQLRVSQSHPKQSSYAYLARYILHFYAMSELDEALWLLYHLQLPLQTTYFFFKALTHLSLFYLWITPNLIEWNFWYNPPIMIMAVLGQWFVWIWT